MNGWRRSRRAAALAITIFTLAKLSANITCIRQQERQQCVRELCEMASDAADECAYQAVLQVAKKLEEKVTP